MGVAACNADLSLRASTQAFPNEFGCWVIGSRARATEDKTTELREWSTVATLPSGRVYVSVMPIANAERQLGFVILLHDLSYIEQREAQARRFLIMGFVILAILAYGVPLFVAKWARYGWSTELRQILRNGGEQKPEFQPILRDLREMIGYMTSEREDAPGQWTAERLKQTLNRHLRGEKVVIVANREPYVHQWTSDGGIEVQHPASGLVTALEPVMRACSGIWISHGSGSADRETVDRRDHVAVPPGEESYVLRRVWLSEEEENGYYYGFANEGLWPLCHVAPYPAGIPRRRLAAILSRQSEVRRRRV